MATSSISGLASGLDTATIISQLMQIEATTQTRLKTRMTSVQSNVTTLQALNTKLAALATTAADLARPTALNPVSATSSSTSVTATAQAGAVPGTLAITVDATAQAHRLTFATTAALTDVVTGASTTVRLTDSAGATQDLDTGDGTLSGLMRALNASGTGVHASTLKLDDGTYRLRVESTATGADSTFTLTAEDGTDLLGGATVRAGTDAAITVGTDTVHSATNTFTGILPGVDVTLSPATPPGTAVELTVATDTTAAKASVKAMVDAVNAVLDDLASATRSNATSTSSSSSTTTSSTNRLAGDPVLRSVQYALTDAVFPTDGTSMSTVGVQVDRYGRLTFDEAAFDSAVASDPTAVTAAITGTTGFAARVQAAATSASDPIDGAITSTITSRKTQISRLQDSIDSWDDRLALRKETLTRQYTALETALSNLQSQSSWLSSQIASLSSSSSES